jgi:hypothetical protein
MLQPKVSTILPRAKNQPKAKTSTSKQKARPARDLPEMAFPTSHDLKHAMLAFTACYGCGAVVPEAGLLLDCDTCAARMCGECNKYRRKCPCQQIRETLNSDKFGEGATLMTGRTDNAPCDERYTSEDDCCIWYSTVAMRNKKWMA